MSSSNGSASTSPSTQSTSTPAAAARARAAGKCSGVRSTPVTRPPASAAGIATLPVPHAASSDGGARPDAGAVDEALADLGDERRERGVIAGRPHGALVLLVVRQCIDHDSDARRSRAPALRLVGPSCARRADGPDRPLESSPRRWASATAAARDEQRSFAWMFATWRCTVCSLSVRRPAIWPVAEPFRDEPQHLDLARTELAGAAPPRAAVPPPARARSRSAAPIASSASAAAAASRRAASTRPSAAQRLGEPEPRAGGLERRLAAGVALDRLLVKAPAPRRGRPRRRPPGPRHSSRPRPPGAVGTAPAIARSSAAWSAAPAPSPSAAHARTSSSSAPARAIGAAAARSSRCGVVARRRGVAAVQRGLRAPEPRERVALGRAEQLERLGDPALAAPQLAQPDDGDRAPRRAASRSARRARR